ncbi:MAG: RagB/SusD family nutrient uptake outer membrane protein [Edaphocola sp.]
MTYYKYLMTAALGISLLASSCTKDLDRQPFVEETSESVYKDPAKIYGVLAKLYAGLTLAGQASSGQDDISSNDGGTTVFFRNFWVANELSTDEAVIAWADGDLPSVHTMTWTASNDKLQYWYTRIMYEVGLCNEFLRQTTDDKMAENGITGSDLEAVHTYRAEARFLRALAYWYGIDSYGSLPFVDENSDVGAFEPSPVSRADLFAYVEAELQDIETALPDARANEYGRADKGCAWMLLAKLYLNARVYTGTERAADCITYCNKIIGSSAYNLNSTYAHVFMTDNQTTSNEIIFPVRSNGLYSQSYGNSTFLIHAKIGGSMNAADWGVASGWGGLRTTKSFVEKFSDISGNTDQRAMFYTDGQELEINSIATFTDGYAIKKFSNLSSTGVEGSDPAGNFCDLDFPLFRYADVLLMYAEAYLRGGGGDAATALGYVNQVRERAYGNTDGDIAAADLTLDFMLDERARELYWEGHRRSDLIRFGKFTGADYIWPWKGGSKDGASVGDYRALFPIPTSELNLNSNMVQNPGY